MPCKTREIGHFQGYFLICGLIQPLEVKSPKNNLKRLLGFISSVKSTLSHLKNCNPVGSEQFGHFQGRTVPYIQGSALQSGFLPKSDASSSCIRKCMLLPIMLGDFGLPSLLLSDFDRNPDCNAEP